MSSLKRLLNPDVDEAPEQRFYSGQASQTERHQYSSIDGEIPALANTSWDDLWSGLLHMDVGNHDFSSLLNRDEADNASFYNAEDGIESWAAQSLPAGEISSHPQPIHIESSSTSFSVDVSAVLCYGMIYRVTVKIVGDMLEVESKLKTGGRSPTVDYYTFSVARSSNQMDLRFQDGTKFGILNTHTSKALEGLIDLPSIQFDALGAILTIRETIGRSTKANDAIIHVNINVYGSLDESKIVGRCLSEHKVYLQRPDIQRPGSTYDNPHLLKFPDMQLPDLEYQLEVAPSKVSTSDDTECLRKTISNVYASLTRGAKLNRIEGDRRVKTQLLPGLYPHIHQQEALDFMEQRENGPIPLDFCLWKPMEGENEGWYCHAVTKAKSRIQGSETGGGILADEMGMGKSLSILSLIAKTIESSYAWTCQHNEDILDGGYASQRLSRATLVIVPSAILINEWVNEINIHLDGTLKTIKYHGPKRRSLASAIEEADIILTTYHTLVADFGEKSSPLHKVCFFRVVLDEAHIIRRQVTTFYRAVSELKARSRWCLTGTPIQNRLEDIGALFAFIRASPFHSIAMFRRFVTIPFDESEERRVVAIRNLTLLLDSLCLRRSKDLLHLPEQQNRVHVVEFSKEEQDQYDQTKKIMNRALRQKVGESYSKSIFGMFQVQLQLRILCNHGTYQHSFSWTKRSLLDEKEDALCSTGGSSEVNCSACRQSMPILGSNNIYRAYTGNCAHVLCSECLDVNEQVNGGSISENSKCPLCAISGVPFAAVQAGTATNDKASYLRNEGHSSKMAALITDIWEDLWKTKSIIFSCWTNTLNLIERHLCKESIPFSRIDGECPLSRRLKILDDFSNTSTIPVLIMTTGTGAFGLNITSANRVFIIEPQWNPSVENQAIARAIRMRQKHSVLVTRYVVKDTVEQEMRSQQKRKLRIAEIGK